ncbi:MAG: RNA-directed DNA polymerase [Candidatus Peregrinibacteria bacterium GW2011_GWC2_39_14]|nr:MAG: RNA-directed DNA polymerase [Candidatus Peregrinibacteria bacterium GW2011_GWC2_39_14]
MDELDQFFKHQLKIKYYVRYADDFVILDNDCNVLTELIPKIQGFLQSYLKISLHPQKISITKFKQGIDFLGYICFPHYRLIRAKTRKRMFKKLGTKIEKFKNKEIDAEKLNQSLQSYLGMLKHANSFKLKIKIKPNSI